MLIKRAIGGVEAMKREVDCREVATSDDYIELIEIGSTPDTSNMVCVSDVSTQIKIAYAKTAGTCIESYLSQPDVSAKIPNVYGLSGKKGFDKSGSQALSEQSKSNFTGKGVLIAIMDTGIDYTHEAFINKDGTSKIWRIWDQTGTAEPVPKGLSFGTEYTREQINEALKATDPFSVVPEKDENGHGTFLAGLAVGIKKEEETYYPIAEDAELIIVKLKQARKCLKEFFFVEGKNGYSEADVLFGVRYIYEVAWEAKRPVVILFTGESWMGSHRSREGTPTEVVIEDLGRNNGVVFVNNAGDEADKSHHYRGDIKLANTMPGAINQSVSSSNQTLTEQVQFNIDYGLDGLVYSMWVQQPDLLTVELKSPQGSSTGKVPYQTKKPQEFKFVKEDTRIIVYYVYRERLGGQEVIYFTIERPIPGQWVLEVSGTNVIRGTFNIWLPVSAFITDQTGFFEPTPDETVTIPATSAETITIGAYNGQYNSIYVASGRGFTPDGGIKPDVVEIGENVVGPVPGQKYESMTGTAMAAAIAAGKVALLLEWGIVDKNDPSIDTVIAKGYLIGGADKKPNITYPSREWGYGTINIEKTILKK